MIILVDMISGKLAIWSSAVRFEFFFVFKISLKIGVSPTRPVPFYALCVKQSKSRWFNSNLVGNIIGTMSEIFLLASVLAGLNDETAEE